MGVTVIRQYLLEVVIFIGWSLLYSVWVIGRLSTRHYITQQAGQWPCPPVLGTLPHSPYISLANTKARQQQARSGYPDVTARQRASIAGGERITLLNNGSVCECSPTKGYQQGKGDACG